MRTTEFEQYPLSRELLEALSLLGYYRPTLIQEKVLPPALAGCDLIAGSATGTGKTAAFAIPVCEGVVWEENAPQALVLEPTRELAVQVREEIFHIGRRKRLKVPAVFGGFPIDKQIQTLKQKSHIVVGTPGRVLDHIRRGSMKLTAIRYLVVDEADLMFDMGFFDEVNSILKEIADQAEKPQTFLFSATIDERIELLAGSCMKDPQIILIPSESKAADTVEQFVCRVQPEEKFERFMQLFFAEAPEEAMIFCATKEMVNVLFRRLGKEGVRGGILHGDMDQSDRLKTIEAFRSGKLHYLIATDVAARGVDFEGITHVLNYDFPTGKEAYVHRIGRTGRNGRSGKAFSFVTPEEEKQLKAAEAYIGKEIPEYTLSPVSEEEKKAFLQKAKYAVTDKVRKGSELNRSIMKISIGGGKRSKMRTQDVVGAICHIEGIRPEDIGSIDIRESLTYVEIMNHKGPEVLAALETRPIKGKIRKCRKTRAEM